jgi:hypothetical protein
MKLPLHPVLTLQADVLIIWAGVLFIALILVPETYHPVLLARKAVQIRKHTNNEEYHTASELVHANKSIAKTLLHSLYRPFQLLVLDPMCLCLCLYSALILGVIYLFFGTFPLVFAHNHDFVLWQTGLTFIGLMVGMVLSAFTNPLWDKNYIRLIAKAQANGHVGKPDPELRLPPAILGAVFLPISLFWFGWTTYSSVHWIVPIIGSVFFGAR